MQCGEIGLHAVFYASSLRWSCLQHEGNLFGDDFAHRQIVVGDHVEPAPGFFHLSCRAGYLDPTDFGVRRGQRFRKPVQREGQCTLLSRKTRVAVEWFQIVVVEHLVGDDGHLMVVAKPHDGFTFRRFDI
ncbi:Uncharacterised protein [Chlamydia trachomatis]|nr:Uncharacterised protein [Chlamydia trachomatis]